MFFFSTLEVLYDASHLNATAIVHTRRRETAAKRTECGWRLHAGSSVRDVAAELNPIFFLGCLQVSAMVMLCLQPAQRCVKCHSQSAFITPLLHYAWGDGFHHPFFFFFYLHRSRRLAANDLLLWSWNVKFGVYKVCRCVFFVEFWRDSSSQSNNQKNNSDSLFPFFARHSEEAAEVSPDVCLLPTWTKLFVGFERPKPQKKRLFSRNPDCVT